MDIFNKWICERWIVRKSKRQSADRETELVLGKTNPENDEVIIRPAASNFCFWNEWYAKENALTVKYYFLPWCYRSKQVSPGRYYVEKFANSEVATSVGALSSFAGRAPYEWRLHIVNREGGEMQAKSEIAWPNPPEDLLTAVRTLSEVTGWKYTYSSENAGRGARVKKRFLTNRSTFRRVQSGRGGAGENVE